METRSGTGQCADQGGATLAEGSAGEVVVTECEQVERVMDGVWGLTIDRPLDVREFSPTCFET